VLRRAHPAHDPLMSHNFSPWFSKIYFNIIILSLYVSQVASSFEEFFISSIHSSCLAHQIFLDFIMISLMETGLERDPQHTAQCIYGIHCEYVRSYMVKQTDL
jgi:hypothetical protein